MFTTLNLTIAECKVHDADMLTRIATAGRPRSIAEMFDGCSPRWATDAADRLQADGFVTEDEHGRLTIAVGKKAG